MRRLSSPFAALVGASLTAGIAVSGCIERPLAAVNPCVVSGVVEEVGVANVDKVDVLFVIDNSGSMLQEQAALSGQISRLVRVLASGDLNEDGARDFEPVKDLHVGVTTTDLGTAPTRVGTCNESGGQNGALVTSPAVPTSACQSSYTPVQSFQPGGAMTAEDFARGVACLAETGITGCGFEQQLEATLRAVTPSTSNVTFYGGTRGQGDLANQGLIRPDSLLAIILLSDEEDCSASDPAVFDAQSPLSLADPIPGVAGQNTRCARLASQVTHPITRYIDGLLDLRRDNPDLLVFAPIVGVPPEIVTDVENQNFGAILDHPRMRIELDNEGTTCPITTGGMTTPQPRGCLVPACQSTNGRADPARRIVEVARGLEAQGANAVVQSICQEDYRPVLDAILKKIADALDGTCLPRALNPDDQGEVPCVVAETLPKTGDITRCSQLESLGRTPLRIADDGREVCQVAQVVPGTTNAPGWFYDIGNPAVQQRCGERPRISFVPGAEPANFTTVRLECLQPVQNTGSQNVAGIGSPCTDDATCATSTMAGLQCEPSTRTCQTFCASSADCRAGFICDSERATPFCRNPICGS